VVRETGTRYFSNLIIWQSLFQSTIQPKSFACNEAEGFGKKGPINVNASSSKLKGDYKSMRSLNVGRRGAAKVAGFFT
jgi:hypothetical protein